MAFIERDSTETRNTINTHFVGYDVSKFIDLEPDLKGKWEKLYSFKDLQHIDRRKIWELYGKHILSLNATNLIKINDFSQLALVLRFVFQSISERVVTLTSDKQPQSMNDL